MSIVYLNGDFIPVQDACVPVTDRGFLFGDGVYEVIPAYGGRLFRLPHHLQRLQNSLDGIRLTNPLTAAEWEGVFNTLLQRNSDTAGTHNDQAVYLQVTRGSAAQRDHGFPAVVTPTVYATSNPIAGTDPHIAQYGVAAVTLDDIRWRRCDIKAITLLANVLLRQQALDQQAVEAILIHDGVAIEGSASNLFVVSDDVIMTPPKSECLLPGITRDLVLELAGRHSLAFQETEIPVALLAQASEIWVTSSTREILPITQLDQRPVGAAKPGPVWHAMSHYYRDYKEAVRNGLAD